MGMRNNYVGNVGMSFEKMYVRLRDFDLKVGDKVSHREHSLTYSTNEDGTRDTMVSRTYRVTGIYPHVFTVININGIKTSFMKVEYQLGEVRRINE